MRRVWLARLAAIADRFLAAEALRQSDARPVEGERTGALVLPARDFRLTAKADRIDLCDDGTLRLYDYKTGKPPTKAQQMAFSKQLLLEAVIAEQAGFSGIAPAPVSAAAYLGLNAALDVVPAPLDERPVPRILAELDRLLAAYEDPATGYTAQTAPATEAGRFESDYLHLARGGEWDLSDAPVRERVGPWT